MGRRGEASMSLQCLSSVPDAEHPNNSLPNRAFHSFLEHVLGYYAKPSSLNTIKPYFFST